MHLIKTLNDRLKQIIFSTGQLRPTDPGERGGGNLQLLLPVGLTLPGGPGRVRGGRRSSTPTTLALSGGPGRVR